MLGWFAELTPRERRTMGACFGGWSLDALDVQIFSFVIPTLLSLWHISTGQAGLGTVTLLVSAFGGWFAGALADRVGRVRVLQITIVGMPSSPSYAASRGLDAALHLPRLAGVRLRRRVGGRRGADGRGDPRRFRGRAVGLVQTGWAVGWGAAALIYTGLFAWLPEELAWRALFWIGILPAGLVFFIRRYVEEPEIARDAPATSLGLAHVISPLRQPHLPTVLKVVLMVTGAQGGSYALGIWLPTYLKTVRHLTAVGTGSYLFVLILGSFCGFVAGAYLADGIGRKATFMVSAIGSIVLTLIYLFCR